MSFLRIKVIKRQPAPPPSPYVINAMYDNKAVAVKVGNENSSWFPIKSEVKQDSVLSTRVRIILMNFVLRSTMGEHRIKRGRKFSWT